MIYSGAINKCVGRFCPHIFTKCAINLNLVPGTGIFFFFVHVYTVPTYVRNMFFFKLLLLFAPLVVLLCPYDIPRIQMPYFFVFFFFSMLFSCSSVSGISFPSPPACLLGCWRV